MIDKATYSFDYFVCYYIKLNDWIKYKLQTIRIEEKIIIVNRSICTEYITNQHCIECDHTESFRIETQHLTELTLSFTDITIGKGF